METERNIISGKFYEVTVRGLFAQPNGMQKMSHESVSFLASSFTEAEQEALNQFGDDVEVKRISIAPYTEALLCVEKDEPTFFYKIRVSYFDENENTGKSAKHSICYLVQSTSTNMAEKSIKEKLLPIMQCGYIISGVVQTKLSAVIK